MQVTFSNVPNGLIKVNQEIAFSGQKFGNLKNEISGRVRNWELKTRVSNLRFNAYFNVSFTLFLSNY